MTDTRKQNVLLTSYNLDNVTFILFSRLYYTVLALLLSRSTNPNSLSDSIIHGAPRLRHELDTARIDSRRMRTA